MKHKFYLMGIFLVLSLFLASSVLADYDAWNGNSYQYNIGDIVSYNDENYIVIQAHTSQAGWNPSVVPALFDVFQPLIQTDEWQVGYPYQVGQIVKHNDIWYRVIQAHTSQSDWNPSIVPALFEQLIDYKNNKPILQKNNITIEYHDEFIVDIEDVAYGFKTSKTPFGNVISIDSINRPNLNKSATIKLQNDIFNSTPIVYKQIGEGENATYEKVNVIVNYNNQTKEVSFDVDGFSSYTVQFNYIYDIRDKRVTYVGTIDPDGDTLSVWVRYRETGDPWGTLSSSPKSISTLSIDEEFIVSGLSENTQYDFQLVAFDGTSTYTSAITDETTLYSYLPARPYSEPAESIGDTTATLKTDIALRCHSQATLQFYYRKQGASSWTSTSTQSITSDGYYTQALTGLSSGTVYEFYPEVAFSSSDYTCNTNTYPEVESIGTWNLNPSTFTTTGTASAIQIQTDPATSITTSSARINGQITDLGGESSVDLYFQYRLVGASSWTESTPETVTGIVSTWEDLTGLSNTDEYEFRLCADYNSISQCAGIRTFTVGGVTTDLTTDLVSYWKFDETSGTTASDSHGENDGDVTGATWTTGKINNGLDFDGVDDHVVVGSGLLSNGNSFSINIWVNANEFYTYQNFISSHDSDDGFSVQIGVDNKFRFFIRTNSGSNNVDSTTSPLTNNWYMVSSVYDSVNDELKIYIDGDLENTITSVGTYSDGNRPIWIGKDENYGNPSDGKIDEVGIWSRVLSSDEVSALYNNGDGLSYDEFEATVEELPTVSLQSYFGLDYNEVIFESLVILNQYSEVDVYFQYKESTSATWLDSPKITFNQNLWETLTYNVIYKPDNTLAGSDPVETYHYLIGEVDGIKYVVFFQKITGLSGLTNYDLRGSVDYDVLNYIGTGTGETGTALTSIEADFTTLEQPPFDDVELSSLIPAVSLPHNGDVDLGVYVTLNGYTTADVTFYYKKNVDSVYTASPTSTVTSDGFTYQTISGLDEETLYDVYAEVEYLEINYAGTELGRDSTTTLSNTFTTQSLPAESIPVISMTQAFATNQTSATLEGYVESLGDYFIVDTYFEYRHNETWVQTEYQEVTAINLGVQSPLPITQNIDILFPDETYHARFCVLYNVSETFCSGSISFNIGEIIIPPSTGDNATIPPGFEDNTEFGDLINTLTGGSQLTKILLGFFLVLAVIFGAVGTFGQNNMQFGTMGIMTFTIIGVILATVLGLFPIFIMILFILSMIILIVLKQMFFSGTGE